MQRLISSIRPPASRRSGTAGIRQGRSGSFPAPGPIRAQAGRLSRSPRVWWRCTGNRGGLPRSVRRWRRHSGQSGGLARRRPISGRLKFLLPGIGASLRELAGAGEGSQPAILGLGRVPTQESSRLFTVAIATGLPTVGNLRMGRGSTPIGPTVLRGDRENTLAFRMSDSLVTQSGLQ